ncbi:NAD-dependent epimerase/dehydratase family protein, partial [Candidatus Pelagibacter sp.]|nr:NAD-dependent epimerase/dehydratase family protein [Candidatus Pelagibacter sp.]
YSATSASIGNKGNDSNLSPYAFSKAKNLEMLENLKRWYKFKFEIIYFYNVYGPMQIGTGSMATVVGIFEEQYKKNKFLTVVKPGTQSRRFTHIDDTVKVCYFAWKKNMCRHYSISNKKNYSIIQVAKFFSSKIKFLPPRKGERYASALTSMNLSNKVYKMFGKIKLREYVKEWKKTLKK